MNEPDIWRGQTGDKPGNNGHARIVWAGEEPPVDIPVVVMHTQDYLALTRRTVIDARPTPAMLDEARREPQVRG